MERILASRRRCAQRLEWWCFHGWLELRCTRQASYPLSDCAISATSGIPLADSDFPWKNIRPNMGTAVHIASGTIGASRSNRWVPRC